MVKLSWPSLQFAHIPMMAGWSKRFSLSGSLILVMALNRLNNSAFAIAIKKMTLMALVHILSSGAIIVFLMIRLMLRLSWLSNSRVCLNAFSGLQCDIEL